MLPFLVERKMFQAVQFILLMVQLFALIPSSRQNEYTTDELRTQFGQAGKAYNGINSCNRQCDGRPMKCYYEFNVQLYDVLGGCGNCTNNVTSDCFLANCAPANLVARTFITVNRQLPSPSIHVCKDDNIIVDVKNSLDEGTSIHWHGIDQKGTQYMDGVPGVTQCSIPGGGIFRYNFFANVTGTYFYHSHLSVQRADGMGGPLIVRDIPNKDLNADQYDVDLPGHCCFLQDWNNQLSAEMAPGTVASLDFPNSLLINGLGAYAAPSANATLALSVPANYTNGLKTVFYVPRGKRCRFRVINACSHACSSDLCIPGYKLTVIATDGFPIVPVTYDCISSSPGERYDFVIAIPNDTSITHIRMTVQMTGFCQNYEIQEFADMKIVDDITKNVRDFSDYLPIIPRPTYADILAENANKTVLNDPYANCSLPNNPCVPSLVAKSDTYSPTENLRNVDAKVLSFVFELFINTDRNNTYITGNTQAVVKAAINSITNAVLPSPILTQHTIMDTCNSNNMTMCPANPIPCHCPHVVQLDLCAVYEFVLINNNTSPEIHPGHMHGYTFYVIDMGTLDDLNSGKTPFQNSKSIGAPKDTVIIPPLGFVRYRFRACNPGSWFLHCHYDFHLFSGMSAIIQVGTYEDLPPPPPNFPTCGDFLSPVSH